MIYHILLIITICLILCPDLSTLFCPCVYFITKMSTLICQCVYFITKMSTVFCLCVYFIAKMSTNFCPCVYFITMSALFCQCVYFITKTCLHLFVRVSTLLLLSILWIGNPNGEQKSAEDRALASIYNTHFYPRAHSR